MSKNGEKSKMPLIIIAVSIVVVIAAIAVIGVMTYFDKINIPFVNDAFVSMGLKDNNKEETNENEKTQNVLSCRHIRSLSVCDAIDRLDLRIHHRTVFQSL